MQLVDVWRGVTPSPEVAVEEVCKGETDLSVWEELARFGVLGTDILVGREGLALLNKHLAMLDPWTGGVSFGALFFGDE